MSVMGSVMGDLDGEEHEAIVGELAEVIGAVLGRHKGRHHRLPPKPSWREGELAPGVMHPDEGMLGLPLTPLQNGGSYTTAFPSITFQGQLQVPFRAERLLAVAARINTDGTGAGRILGQFFVGVHLSQAEIFGMDVEVLGNPQAFGTRMTLIQAPPGVLIRVVTTITNTPVGSTDSVVLPSMIFLGRVIH